MPDRFYGFCRVRTSHISRPQIKSHCYLVLRENALLGCSHESFTLFWFYFSSICKCVFHVESYDNLFFLFFFFLEKKNRKEKTAQHGCHFLSPVEILFTEKCFSWFAKVFEEVGDFIFPDLLVCASICHKTRLGGKVAFSDISVLLGCFGGHDVLVLRKTDSTRIQSNKG